MDFKNLEIPPLIKMLIPKGVLDESLGILQSGKIPPEVFSPKNIEHAKKKAKEYGISDEMINKYEQQLKDYHSNNQNKEEISPFGREEDNFDTLYPKFW